ncbi:MAG: hypothetical protein N3B13_11825, partial [Deltaproteobacteria bacterium]|nr:hypothetical protein [Deltaproteobacteria bacterium]
SISGGWEYNSEFLPANQTGFIKFKGYVTGGSSNVSSYMEEFVYQYYLMGYKLKISFEGNGNGKVNYFDPRNINNYECPAKCSHDYLPATNITLQNNPGTGSTFGGWGGDCVSCSDNYSCTITMNSDKSCTARFLLEKYPVAVKASGDGSGNISSEPSGISFNYPFVTTGSAEYEYGSNLVLSAASADGTTAKWSLCGGVATGNDSSVAVCTLNNITGPQSAEAVFMLNKYVISSSVQPSEGGSVVCDPNPVPHGSKSVCTITPMEGYFIKDIGGSCTGTMTGNIYEIGPVTSECSISVEFSNIYEFSVSINGNGKVTSEPQGIDCGSDCSEQYEYNTKVVLYATPDNDYSFAYWGGGCFECHSDSICELNVDTHKYCVAVFEPVQLSDAGFDTKEDSVTDISVDSGNDAVTDTI